MRILSGKFKNKKILSSSGRIKEGDIRPTTAKIREAIYNILEHSDIMQANSFEEVKMLDVCCGTGIFGLEGISRGIGEVCFIDVKREHVNLVRKNIEILGVQEEAKTICADASQLPESKEIFQVIYIDPPYIYENIQQILESLMVKGWINEESLIIIESSSKFELSIPGEFKVLESRVYGSTRLNFLMILCKC